jgi:hypothetical protein
LFGEASAKTEASAWEEDSGGKFFDHEKNRERDLILIDYDDPDRPSAARRNA